MTLKRRARDARFSTRGADPNRRAGRRRRREVQTDWAPPKKTSGRTRDFVHDETARRWLSSEGRWLGVEVGEEAETRDEGMDGVHPRDA